MAQGHIHVVAAIIEDGAGRMLMVRKHGTRSFILPGGKPEPGEGLVAALTRELDEELALTLDPGDFDALGDFDTEAANEAEHTLLGSVFVYLPGGAGLAPRARAEIAEARWVPYAEPSADVLLAPLTRDHAVPQFLARLAARE